MGEAKQRQREKHLIILLVYTFLTIALTGESVLMGWDMGAVVLLLLGLVINWTLHITEQIPESVRLWIYFALTMLASFFYGIHETSIYDLAPLMLVIIVMYSITDNTSIINFCVFIYFFIMGYDFLFVLGTSVEVNSLMVTRTILHLVLVYLAGYLTKLVIIKRRRERVNTEKQIEELEETNRRVEDFLTNVSHELRTPINAVTGITAVMLDKEENADKKKDILSIQMAGNRLFGQIEDILDYTEIDTGRVKVSEDSYMISSVVNDIITGNRLSERENMPELIFDIDADIPSVLLGDEKKIKKILKHLIDNALKFTYKGGVYVRIFALPKPYGINLCIQVSDTGMGIAAEEMGRIKERFYQSSGGRNRKAGGLGLGLPIVYGMVSAMKGFMQIESTEGRGTTVSVSIPQKVVDESSGMTITNRENLCLACFVMPEQFEVPEVRNYYNEMISHMVQGLDIPLHRISNMDELGKLTSMYQLTHLFIGEEEYKENAAYFEDLDQNIEVVVAANNNFVLPQHSRVKLIRKPISCLPIIRILNAEASGDVETLKKKHMICPGIRVLVVDDEPMNLIVAEGIFKTYQMIVKTAESGWKAIELCEKEEFDLIFLDHMMPEMDGVETLKQLRRIYTNENRVFTVIAFTANAVSGAREMFLREGFDEFVSKPIEPLEMERVLRKVLPKASIAFVDDDYGKQGTTEGIELQSTQNDGIPDGQIIENHSKEDEFEKLERAGIHARSAIQYCCGDKEFYKDLLIKFAKDTDKKSEQIDAFFQQEDFENYCIQVHALKSAAKMVGADFLSEHARQAEEASKNYDVDYIREHHGELLAEYHQTEQCIFDVFDLTDSDFMQAAQGNGTELSGEELIERLHELKAVLDTFEADKAESLLSDMKEAVYGGTLIGDLLYDVQQDVEDFEFGAASGKVDDLIRKVEGGDVG
ncbi:MAG: ATP-binding protein [Lachnospiraceae bacterium]